MEEIVNIPGLLYFESHFHAQFALNHILGPGSPQKKKKLAISFLKSNHILTRILIHSIAKSLELFRPLTVSQSTADFDMAMPLPPQQTAGL